MQRKRKNHHGGKKVPKIYLDTVIIRKAIESKPASILNLLQTIKERNWVAFSSALSMLELSDLKKDDVYLVQKVRQKEEYKSIIRGRDHKELTNSEIKKVREYLENFLKKYPFVSFYQIPIEVWEDAATLSLNSNIHAKDSIHVASALNFKADIFLTEDSHLIKHAEQFFGKQKVGRKMKAITPDKIYETLADMGFKVGE